MDESLVTAQHNCRSHFDKKSPGTAVASGWAVFLRQYLSVIRSHVRTQKSEAVSYSDVMHGWSRPYKIVTVLNNSLSKIEDGTEKNISVYFEARVLVFRMSSSVDAEKESTLSEWPMTESDVTPHTHNEQNIVDENIQYLI